MLGNSWFKKEKPFLGLTGFGGGVGSNLVGGAGAGAVYTEATGGTTNDYTEPGPGKNYRAHIFLASGAFSVTQVGNADGGGATVEYLVVAGGGGGGGTSSAGGGRGGAGAGGLRTNLTGHPLAESKDSLTHEEIQQIRDETVDKLIFRNWLSLEPTSIQCHLSEDEEKLFDLTQVNIAKLQESIGSSAEDFLKELSDDA